MPRYSAAGMQTIPFSANTGLKAPCESSRYKVEDFLNGVNHPNDSIDQTNQMNKKRQRNVLNDLTRETK